MLRMRAVGAMGFRNNKTTENVRLLLVLAALTIPLVLPQPTAAQVSSPDGFWLRMGWFAPVTSMPSRSRVVEGSVKLDAQLAFGASAEWVVRPSWRTSLGLTASGARVVPRARGDTCQELQVRGLPCEERWSEGGFVLHGHAALLRDMGAVRAGLGLGPRILKIPDWDCLVTFGLCGLAADIHQQAALTVMGLGMVAVEHTLFGRGVRVDLHHGVSLHGGSVQHELVLSGGVAILR